MNELPPFIFPKKEESFSMEKLRDIDKRTWMVEHQIKELEKRVVELEKRVVELEKRELYHEQLHRQSQPPKYKIMSD